MMITCLPPPAQQVLLEQLRLTEGVFGDVAELGVYKGGSAAILAASTDRTVHLFDTFHGMPQSEACDKHSRGAFGDTSFAEVKEALKDFRNVRFHVGQFPFSASLLYHSDFSFVHLDADLHRSTLDGLRFFYPKVSRGGIILLDDYCRDDCPGVELAVTEFLEGREEQVEIVGDGQARIVKL